MRNKIRHHITRLNEGKTCEKRQALVSQIDKNSLR